MKTSNYSLIRIVCALIIGLVLVLWPDVATKYITITLGMLFLVPGLISIISYYASKPVEGQSRRFPVEGIGSLLFGMWLVAMPDFFADVLMFILAFLLMLGGIQLIATLSIARRWSAVPGGYYVLPVLILLTGLVSLFNLSGARNTVLMVIGISSIVYSLSELINWFRFLRHRPQNFTQSKIEEAEIIESD